MGGCLSTNIPSKHPRNSGNTPPNTTNIISKSPPQSHAFQDQEEETVKEVLSETPSARARVYHQTDDGPFIKNAPLLLHEDDVDVFFKKPSDDVSECEIVFPEKNNEKLRHQSPAKRFSGEARRDKTIGKSPNRARPGNLRRGEGGERSGRRSRSPVTRTDPGDSGRRKMGKSPGRVRSGLGESRNNRKVEGEKEVVGENMWPPKITSGESLENPVVSMECFIFL